MVRKRKSSVKWGVTMHRRGNKPKILKARKRFSKKEDALKFARGLANRNPKMIVLLGKLA